MKRCCCTAGEVALECARTMRWYMLDGNMRYWQYGRACAIYHVAEAVLGVYWGSSGG